MDSRAAHDQVERILRSSTFAAKHQLKKLLELLLNNFDCQSNLTPELVIRTIWPNETRTKRSADVATEMNRLRNALDRYYEGEGAHDLWIVELPIRTAALNGTHEKLWIVVKPREPRPETPTGAEQAHQKPPASVRWISYAGRIGTGVLAASVLAGLALWIMGAFMLPDQPSKGSLEGSSLVIRNAKGQELWRKTFSGGFGPESYYGKEFGEHIWFADLEGKGHTSILFSYLPGGDSLPHSSTLICYSDRGKEKWRWNPGKSLPEVSGPATYRTISLGLLRATGKRPARIVALSDHDPWWGGPSQIALIDSNGRTVSEYWQSGGLHDLAIGNMDRYGSDEIIATGVAHGYASQATLVVLDPDNMAGASKEVNPEYQIHGMGIAEEKLRLLFPRSDLNLSSFAYNYGAQPKIDDTNLGITVIECLAPVGCPIHYEFDSSFNLVSLDATSEEFRSAHDLFYRGGNHPHALNAEERAAFLRIRCLTGCKSEFLPVAQTYDPSLSFEKGWGARLNPNGVWSYGYTSSAAGQVTLYDKTLQNGINGPNSQYWVSSAVNKGTSPAAEFNNGPRSNDGNIDFLAGEFLLVAGIAGQYSDLVFTAPADSDYSISGSFRGAQYGVGTVAGITANGNLVFRSPVGSVNQPVPFHSALKLRAGNTVVFSVGPGTGAQNTGLALTITRSCALTDKPKLSQAGAIVCGANPGID